MTLHAVAASSDAAGVQPDEGGSQPTPLLHFFDLPIQWGDRYEVRPISQATAARWCAKYHYSGNAGPENGTFWGFYLGDLACVVGFGVGANEYGLAKKFALTAWQGNIEICRVAAHPDAPRNTTSRAVAAVLRTAQATAGTSWVYSYADTGQNHHGGIYQALTSRVRRSVAGAAWLPVERAAIPPPKRRPSPRFSVEGRRC